MDNFLWEKEEIKWPVLYSWLKGSEILVKAFFSFIMMHPLTACMMCFGTESQG